ncbi:hypothetical protein L596_030381 [Steinernema carpocapsae]|uniref:Uncharacterized protein n=1 Tax=Steinernema carpocapsae TaxID=34508 RepID=A0A4U5LP79_STECR|nr:hypothetical protein L596_030381 [Steinernema carpocapsae]
MVSEEQFLMTHPLVGTVVHAIVGIAEESAVVAAKDGWRGEEEAEPEVDGRRNQPQIGLPAAEELLRQLVACYLQTTGSLPRVRNPCRLHTTKLNRVLLTLNPYDGIFTQKPH